MEPASAFPGVEAVAADDLVDVFFPEAYVGFLATFGPEFGGFEEDDNEAIERINFVLV